MAQTHQHPESSRDDLEKAGEQQSIDENPDGLQYGSSPTSRFHKLTRRLMSWNVESRGIWPIPFSQRTDPQFHKAFFLWFAFNTNILSISAGTLGPLTFGLSFRDSALIIFGFNVIGCLLPAYFSTFGPKLGLRQMCQARYSFGFYGAILPATLNLATMMGYLILTCILAGQTLSSASGNFGAQSELMSWDVGIVVIAVISLLVSFFGYRVMHYYERFAWIPVTIVFLIAIGLNARHMTPSTQIPAATHTQVLSFGASIAGYVISFAPLSADFSTYMRGDVSSFKVFSYTYVGLFVPACLVQILGAAFAAAIPNNPTWAMEEGDLAGLLHAVLLPCGQHFTRFLLVILAFSVAGNIAPTMYSFCLSFQVMIPSDITARIPRYVFSILATAILIPLAIVGSTKFYETLSNFLGLVGYWSSVFGAIVLTEHLVFRRGNFANYNISHWNQPGKLPLGLAAIVTSLLAAGVVVVSMEEVWFTGPLAKKSGDVAFELGFASAVIFYLPLRTLERRWRR